MKWETKEPAPQPAGMKLEDGKVRLSMHQTWKNTWQHFQMSFGDYTDEPLEKCAATWPLEAIARARKLLDEFERKWENEYEANLEKRTIDGGAAQAGSSDAGEGA